MYVCKYVYTYVYDFSIMTRGLVLKLNAVIQDMSSSVGTFDVWNDLQY